MESPQTSLETREEISVVFSLYFVYVGGNLGVFFGINVYGVFKWVFGQDEQRKCNKTKARFNVFISVSRYTTVVIGLCPFLLTLSKDYFVEQKTTALLRASSSRGSEFPKIILGGPVISERKLRSLLGSISDTFWEEENLRAKDTYDENSLPFLCDLVTSLHWVGALTHEFNRSTENFDEHVMTLTKLLDNDSYVKQFGYEKLFMATVEEPSDFVLGVHDQNKALLNYTVKPVLGTSGLYFEIEVHRPEMPTFISQGIQSVTVQTRRHSEFENKCRVRRDVRVSMVAETYENLGLAHDYFLYMRTGDTTISVKAVRTVLKPRRKRPCTDSALSTLRCTLQCHGVRAPCRCVMLGYGADIHTRGPVFKAGDLCYRLLPFPQQCPMLRTLRSEVIRDCDDACPAPCERTRYIMNGQFTTSPKGTDPEVQSIRITVGEQDSGSSKLHLEESYSYDFVLYLNSMGGLVSFFFGYSFVTFFSAAVGLCGGFWQLGRAKRQRSSEENQVFMRAM